MDASTSTTGTAEPQGLTLGVLSDVKRILDTAVSRGAFRAEEMSSVGGVYDRYVAGLTALVQKNQAATAEAAPSGEVVETPLEEAGSKP